MQKYLVSVLSPCYNVAPYIPRFLNSLLAQTYKNLEIILVNDGSTDKTAEVIKKYIPRLEQEGYKVIFLEQENGGLASTINNGLKYVTGEFLTWPDPDDWITPDSIEKRVQFLCEHPDAGLVRCNIERIEEATGGSLGLFEPHVHAPELIEDFFEKLALTRTWFGALACMVRMAMFDQVLPDREIYVSRRAGQNFQMLFPMAVNYPCWQMGEVLGYYLVRQNSHSHFSVNLETSLQYIDMSEETLVQTISKIEGKKRLIKEVQKNYAIKRFHTALQFAGIKEQFKYYRLAIRNTSRMQEKLQLTQQFIFPSFIKKCVKKLRNHIRNTIK